MRINQRLNIEVPVDTSAGLIHIHSMPIGREAFERYFLTISKTFSAIYNEGLGPVAGPRVSYMMLKKIAMERGEWEGPEGVEFGLIGEIVRLTNVVMLTPQGWQTVPFNELISKKTLDDEDFSEVMNLLCFFTVVSSMHKKTELPGILNGATQLWGAQTTPLTATEFARSLQTSTETDNIGEKTEETIVSVPS